MLYYLLYMHDRDGSSFRRELSVLYELYLLISSIFLVSYLSDQSGIPVIRYMAWFA